MVPFLILLIFLFIGTNCTGYEIKHAHYFGTGITSLKFTSDGKYLISSDTLGNILVWRLADHKVVANLVGHKSVVNDLYLTKDGKYLISAGSDRTIRVYELPNFDEYSPEDPGIITPDTTIAESKEPVETVVATPDNEYILAGDDEPSLKLFSFGGSLLKIFLWYDKPMYDLVVDNKGQYVYTAGEIFHIYKWPLSKMINSTGFKVKGNIGITPLIGHIDIINTLYITNNNKYLISGGQDGRIIVWNLATGKKVNMIKDLLYQKDTKTYIPANILSLATIKSKKHTYIVAGYMRRTVKLWLFNQNTIDDPFPKAVGRLHFSDVNAVAVSPDNRYIASGDNAGRINIWRFDDSNWDLDFGSINKLKLAFALSPIHRKLKK